MKNDDLYVKSNIHLFFESDANTIFFPKTSYNYNTITKTIQNIILTKGSKGVSNPLKLKIEVIGLINTFIENYSIDNINQENNPIQNKDYERTLKIEQYLCENLEGKFESIDALANRFKISPTKLKNDFKQMFGKPIFQYFQEKQMLLAKELLKNEDIRIKELAHKLGYENMGKFSQAYKKLFNILPSEQRKLT